MLKRYTRLGKRFAAIELWLMGRELKSLGLLLQNAGYAQNNFIK